MPYCLTKAGSFFRGPQMSGNAARTFRFHLAFAVLDAAAGGILLNAPLVAIKTFEAANWHLPLRELYSGIGMIATLYLSSWMAPRRKMPFVLIPSVLAAISALMMAVASGDLDWPTLRKSAYRRHAEHFSARSMADGVAKVYREVLG